MSEDKNNLDIVSLAQFVSFCEIKYAHLTSVKYLVKDVESLICSAGKAAVLKAKIKRLNQTSNQTSYDLFDNLIGFDRWTEKNIDIVKRMLLFIEEKKLVINDLFPNEPWLFSTAKIPDANPLFSILEEWRKTCINLSFINLQKICDLYEEEEKNIRNIVVKLLEEQVGIETKLYQETVKLDVIDVKNDIKLADHVCEHGCKNYPFKDGDFKALFQGVLTFARELTNTYEFLRDKPDVRESLAKIEEFDITNKTIAYLSQQTCTEFNNQSGGSFRCIIYTLMEVYKEGWENYVRNVLIDKGIC